MWTHDTELHHLQMWSQVGVRHPNGICSVWLGPLYCQMGHLTHLTAAVKAKVISLVPRLRRPHATIMAEIDYRLQRWGGRKNVATSRVPSILLSHVGPVRQDVVNTFQGHLRCGEAERGKVTGVQLSGAGCGNGGGCGSCKISVPRLGEWRVAPLARCHV